MTDGTKKALSLFGWMIMRGSTLDFLLERASKPPAELIVCRDAQQAQEIRKQVRGSNIRVGIASLMSTIIGGTYYKITVMPGVDLNQNTNGHGRLIDILRSRQRTFSDPVFLVLP